MEMEIQRHEDMETRRHGDMGMWRHGDMETGDMETWRHGDTETRRYGDIETSTENRKWKPMRFFLIRSLFAHRAKVSLSFVRLFTKNQMEIIHLQLD
jgi:hypothetical protein